MDKNQNKTNKVVQTLKTAAMTAGVGLITVGTAFAEDGSYSIDLTTAVTGVAIVGGLLAAGTLKAVPTYAGWGIKKALSMLR